MTRIYISARSLIFFPLTAALVGLSVAMLLLAASFVYFGLTVGAV